MSVLGAAATTSGVSGHRHLVCCPSPTSSEPQQSPPSSPTIAPVDVRIAWIRMRPEAIKQTLLEHTWAVSDLFSLSTQAIEIWRWLSMTPQLVNRGGHSIRFLDGSGTLEDALEPQLLDPSIVCFQIGCVGGKFKLDFARAALSEVQLFSKSPGGGQLGGAGSAQEELDEWLGEFMLSNPKCMVVPASRDQRSRLQVLLESESGDCITLDGTPAPLAVYCTPSPTISATMTPISTSDCDEWDSDGLECQPDSPTDDAILEHLNSDPPTEEATEAALQQDQDGQASEQMKDQMEDCESVKEEPKESVARSAGLHRCAPGSPAQGTATTLATQPAAVN